jgi:uncharacterized protein
MASGRVQRIQDSVHGLMEFCGMETVVIDVLRTPELQRLRRIRQLGLSQLVFPGAEHSRLAHSLGAAHLAIRFGRHIREVAPEFFTPVLCPDDSAVRDLAVAALCHDLGQGPLSHAWEREIIGDHFDRGSWAKSLNLSANDPLINKMQWHELVTQGLLAYEDGQLHRLLEQHEDGSSERIRRLLSGRYDITYLPRILASDVDVDRADFLRRDTHQTGVAYGRYDLDWLISTCTLGVDTQHKVGKWVLGFDSRKAVRVVEQFLIARQALYETVYHHKTVRCAEAMVGKLLGRLRKSVQGGTEFETTQFVKPLMKIIGGSVLSPEELLALDDFSLSVLIDNISREARKDAIAADLARRILSRDLFKWVPVSSQKIAEFLEREGARAELQEAIKPFCPGDSEYYLIEDKAKFRMMASTQDEKVYLIDGNGVASPAHDHESLRAYRYIEAETRRIYTIREARDEVKKFIEDRVGR